MAFICLFILTFTVDLCQRYLFLPIELPKSDALICSDSLWNVLTVTAGAMGTTETTGISKIVNSIIVPLADNDVSLFCMSTYQGDFILVKNNFK